MGNEIIFPFFHSSLCGRFNSLGIEYREVARPRVFGVRPCRDYGAECVGRLVRKVAGIATAAVLLDGVPQILKRSIGGWSSG
jgi:hypothetical protein